MALAAHRAPGVPRAGGRSAADRFWRGLPGLSRRYYPHRLYRPAAPGTARLDIVVAAANAAARAAAGPGTSAGSVDEAARRAIVDAGFGHRCATAPATVSAWRHTSPPTSSRAMRSVWSPAWCSRSSRASMSWAGGRADRGRPARHPGGSREHQYVRARISGARATLFPGYRRPIGPRTALPRNGRLVEQPRRCRPVGAPGHAVRGAIRRPARGRTTGA